MSPLVHGAAALLLSASTGPTLSITPLGAKGAKWSAEDEGSETLQALFTLANPTTHGAITTIVPGTPFIAPPNALATNGLQAPPTGSAPFASLASGQDLNYGIPYKVTSGGTATIGESISWHNAAHRGRDSAAVSIPLGSALTGTVKLAADTTKVIPGVPVTPTGTTPSAAPRSTRRPPRTPSGNTSSSLARGPTGSTPSNRCFADRGRKHRL